MCLLRLREVLRLRDGLTFPRVAGPPPPAVKSSPAAWLPPEKINCKIYHVGLHIKLQNIILQIFLFERRILLSTVIMVILMTYILHWSSYMPNSPIYNIYKTKIYIYMIYIRIFYIRNSGTWCLGTLCGPTVWWMSSRHLPHRINRQVCDFLSY